MVQVVSVGVVMVCRLLQILESMQARDISVNKAISDYGADHILASSGHQEVNILTICNTGSLATGGYGTALGGLITTIVVCHVVPSNKLYITCIHN